MKKKEEILEALQYGLLEILNVETLNTWISVKDRSINKILSEAGLNKNYSFVVVDELKKLGLIEREGERSGMRYKIVRNVMPDINSIAIKIYDEIQNRKSNNEKPIDGYPVSNSADLRPVISRKNYSDVLNKKNEKIYNGKPKTVKRQVNIPALGDMRFIIFSSRIVECKVVSIHYDIETMSKVLYDLEFVNIESFKINDEEENTFIICNDKTIRDLFDSPEDAADYLIRKVVKYQKRFV